MSKALDRVLQPDGSYKWEEVELIHSTAPVEPKVSASAPKETKKKVLKKKTTSPLSD